MSIANKIRRQFIIRVLAPKIEAYKTIDGFLTPYEAVTLYQLANDLPKSALVIEIGSWKGKSTFCLAQGLRDGQVIAIDPFDASGDPQSHEIYESKRSSAPLKEQFTHAMQARGVLHKIDIWEGYSSQFVDRAPQINMLFIDGDHSIEGCRFDFDNFAHALKPGGILAFHDFDATRKDLGPTWVIENCVVPSQHYQFFGLFDSLWVAKKVSI